MSEDHPRPDVPNRNPISTPPPDPLALLASRIPPARRVLRATRTHLLPHPVVLGLEVALHRICEGLMDEGMGELEALPLEAAGAAIAADLEAVVLAIRELSADAEASSLRPGEIQLVAVAGEIERIVQAKLPLLRDAVERVRERRTGGDDRGPGADPRQGEEVRDDR